MISRKMLQLILNKLDALHSDLEKINYEFYIMKLNSFYLDLEKIKDKKIDERIMFIRNYLPVQKPENYLKELNDRIMLEVEKEHKKND